MSIATDVARLYNKRPKMLNQKNGQAVLAGPVDPEAAAVRRSETGSDKTRQYEVWCVYLSVSLPALHKHFLHYR